ncbi:MAG: HD domain-containing protein [Candidatus Margulisbacteria bacterium]|jgi:HD-GYP domain-containing protein (c-di-GMP phosphodiesterase class II)|nr:HD domain-containing protein [Candidatus Margulisiibacteriota bacterium]
MSNITNYSLGLVMRSAARCIRVAGVAAGTVPVTNKLGTRQALVVGREDRFWNRPLERGPLTAPLDLAALRQEVERFSPQTTRETLEKMVSYLRAWGHKPVAEYYFEMKDGKYGNIVNTSEARSIILSVAFDGEEIAKVDRKLIAGRISGPINDVIHPTRLLRYGINPLLIKLSAYLGYPKSFIILPVCNGQGQVIGKVNIGLKDTVRLAKNKIEVLRLLAEKIKGTGRSNGTAPSTIDMEKVRSFIAFVDSIPVYAFIGSPRVAEGARMLVSLLSSSMERSRAKSVQMMEERTEFFGGIAGVLAAAIETNESYTGGHCTRVAQMSEAISQHLPAGLWRAEIARTNPEITDLAAIDEKIAQRKSQIFNAAVIHDVGKIGIDPKIIKSNSKLTDEEYAAVQQHVTLGAEIIQRVAGSYPEMVQVAETARLHHLDWDGRGYPQGTGLKGREIPLQARIVRATDTTHAMISRRTYDPAQPPEYVVNELVKGCATSFEPVIIRTQLELMARTDLSDIDLMMEEVLLTKAALPAGSESQHSLLDQLMNKLGTGISVGALKKELQTARETNRLLPGAQEIFQQIADQVEAKKQRLIKHAILCREFYDYVVTQTDATGQGLFDLIGLFGQSANYDPGAIRAFIGDLLAVWIDNRKQPFLILAEEAFKRAANQQRAEAFKIFFFGSYKQF